MSVTLRKLEEGALTGYVGLRKPEERDVNWRVKGYINLRRGFVNR